MLQPTVLTVSSKAVDSELIAVKRRREERLNIRQNSLFMNPDGTLCTYKEHFEALTS